ncbi:hypothetical protein [Pararhodobacter sp.]|uniref:hypothetical protein n=1 Tax=Pararhodobacter sp. TaxID=2127056 RepID=UPI002FE36863
MEIALHLGAHLTDQDHLVRCLMRNRAPLLKQGIAVPGPGRYRQQLRQLAFDMRGHETNAQTQEALLDGILDEDNVRRVVFSSDNFLAMSKWALNAGQLYHAAGERVQMLRHLFPEARLELFLCLRNPATFLPALAAEDQTGAVLKQIEESDLAATRWSATVAQILEAAPGVSLTVWADEDTPLLWPEVLRAVSGHAAGMDLAGWLAWYHRLVTPAGHAAMRRWFEQNPTRDDATRRRMLAALLARFVKPEALETDPLPPGWTEETVDALTDLYDEDLDLIAALPGVTLLEP